MTTNNFGQRLLLRCLSLQPGTKGRICRAAVKAFAADDARKVNDFRTAADRYREAYELAAGVDDYGTPLYKLGEAMALSDLGATTGDDAALKRCVKLFVQLVDDPTVVKRRDLWARAAHGYGRAQWNVALREKDIERLHHAVIPLRDSCDIMKQEGDPLAWADVQHDLGDVLYFLGIWENRVELLVKAVLAFEAALTARTREATPDVWAHSQYQLGMTLKALGEMEGKAQYFEGAISAFDASLTVYDPKDTPMNWALAKEFVGKARFLLGKLTNDQPMLASGRRETEAAARAYRKIGEAEGEGKCLARLKEIDAAMR